MGARPAEPRRGPGGERRVVKFVAGETSCAYNKLGTFGAAPIQFLGRDKLNLGRPSCARGHPATGRAEPAAQMGGSAGAGPINCPGSWPDGCGLGPAARWLELANALAHFFSRSFSPINWHVASD